MNATNGKFVWFDLMTTDVEAAKGFYGEILGWRTAKWPGGDNYEVWTMKDKTLGGVMALSAEAREAGTPRHWLGYIGTGDVDASAKQAQHLGGSVLLAPKDIPDTGRYAVLADPHGASFGVYKPFGAETPLEPKALGHFGWSDLSSIDWKAAWKFYANLFAWKHVSSLEMGEGLGTYFMFGAGADEKDMFGGMSNAAVQKKQPAHWLYYVNVNNADETAKRVARMGGQVVAGPMDVPGGGRIADCVDPQGALFGVFAA